MSELKQVIVQEQLQKFTDQVTRKIKTMELTFDSIPLEDLNDYWLGLRVYYPTQQNLINSVKDILNYQQYIRQRIRKILPMAGIVIIEAYTFDLFEVSKIAEWLKQLHIVIVLGLGLGLIIVAICRQAWLKSEILKLQKQLTVQKDNLNPSPKVQSP